MWKELSEYPVLSDQPRITNRQQLSSGVRVVDEIAIEPDLTVAYIFCENNGGLSILIPSYLPFLTTENTYFCHQWDLPLAFLAWFPKNLHDYRLPSDQSPYSGMTTPVMDVGGEMLSLSRGMAVGDGIPSYIVHNWSRHCKPNYQTGEHFRAIRISWTESSLCDCGILAFIQDLGDRWQRGAL